MLLASVSSLWRQGSATASPSPPPAPFGAGAVEPVASWATASCRSNQLLPKKVEVDYEAELEGGRCMWGGEGGRRFSSSRPSGLFLTYFSVFLFSHTLLGVQCPVSVPKNLCVCVSDTSQDPTHGLVRA